MDEKTTSLATQTVAWATVATTPAITQIELPMKTVIKQILIEISGAYDQSVGAESQATEGNVALIDEIRVNLQGQLRRQYKGPALYELNRLVFKSAYPQVDPTTSVAAGKAFSSVFMFDMGLWDTLSDVEQLRSGGYSLRDLQAKTYLDLRNWPGRNYIEIVWKPFNAYVSGNTQANMSATVRATPLELIGYPRINPNDQLHAELVLQDTVDMSVSKTDAVSNLLRDGVYSRGVLLRVGTLAATPIVTAFTALPLVGFKGTFKSGPSIVFKDKLPPTTFQRMAGAERNNVVPRAGSVWLDHSSDLSFGGGIDGNRLSVYQVNYDITGTASTTMQVFQAVARK